MEEHKIEHDNYEMHAHHAYPEESTKEYFKFAFVILFITMLGTTLAWTKGLNLRQFLNDFMAIFFLVFAGFKILQLEVFAIAFRGYDIVTKRWPIWGYIYPFVQLFLGMAYFFEFSITALNVLTIIISAVAGVGVLQELAKKSAIPCACLGNVIKLPLSKVSFVEDLLMLAMAAWMLIV